MKILLVNDDGYAARGIGILTKVLAGRHEVYIAAPDRQRSAVGRAMTLTEPLTATRVTQPFAPEVPCHAVSGYPVDCLRLALGNLYPWPDMVISGINHGENHGTDTLYSGTVGAAAEAAMAGIPAIAVSLTSYEDQRHFDTAAVLAMRLAERLNAHPLRHGTVLNLNVPDLAMDALAGIREAPLAVITYAMPYTRVTLPDGTEGYLAPIDARTSDNSGLDVDERWTHEGYATVTALTYDLTDRNGLDGLSLSGLTD